MSRRAARPPLGPVLAAALAVDVFLGEPPNAVHPVVWLGKSVDWFERLTPWGDPRREFAWGAVATAAVVAGAWTAGALTEALLARLPAPARWAATALFFKSTFSVAALARAAAKVETALAADDLAGARTALRWLVSRRTDELDRPRLAAAAIESVAENLSDSFTAPLLAYALAGLPGALAYRAANTLDAMLGYRDRREWLGKPSARLDDLLNLVPARLTAGCLLLAGALLGAPLRRAVDVVRHDAARTPSPNAGWPMGAMAGVLGVELEKRDHYRLGAGLPLPGASDIGRANRVLGLAVGLTLLAVAVRRW